MTKKQRKESDALGTIRDNHLKVYGYWLRGMENVALSKVEGEKETTPGILELGANWKWCIDCERREEIKEILFCRNKKPECVARGKERR